MDKVKLPVTLRRYILKKKKVKNHVEKAGMAQFSEGVYRRKEKSMMSMNIELEAKR